MNTNATEHPNVDDAIVTMVESRFIRDALQSVYDRRRNSPPKRSERESAEEYDVRLAWWKRAQDLIKASEDLPDDQLLMRLAKGIVKHLDYNSANNLLRAVMANMTYQYRRVQRGIVSAQSDALAKAKQLAGDSAVDSAVDALFAEDDDDDYAGTVDDYASNLTEPVVRYIVESFHAFFQRTLARMYQRDLDNAQKNNAPRPYDFETLCFTTINVDGQYIPQHTLNDAMQALDTLEGERAANAMQAITQAPAISL